MQKAIYCKQNNIESSTLVFLQKLKYLLNIEREISIDKGEIEKFVTIYGEIYDSL